MRIHVWDALKHCEPLQGECLGLAYWHLVNRNSTLVKHSWCICLIFQKGMFRSVWVCLGSLSNIFCRIMFLSKIDFENLGKHGLEDDS